MDNFVWIAFILSIKKSLNGTGNSMATVLHKKSLVQWRKGLSAALWFKSSATHTGKGNKLSRSGFYWVYQHFFVTVQKWWLSIFKISTLKKVNFGSKWYFTLLQRTDKLSISFKVKIELKSDISHHSKYLPTTCTIGHRYIYWIQSVTFYSALFH